MPTVCRSTMANIGSIARSAFRSRQGIDLNRRSAQGARDAIGTDSRTETDCRDNRRVILTSYLDMPTGPKDQKRTADVIGIAGQPEGKLGPERRYSPAVYTGAKKGPH